MSNRRAIKFITLCIGLISATEASSTLFAGATIIGWDNHKNLPSVTRDGYLLVNDDRVAGIFTSYPQEISEDTEVIDATGQIISPGFIDTHRHGWQTALKTLTSNTTLAQYANRYGEFAASTIFDADDVYWGQLAGLFEALNAGVTTSLDHAHHTWSNETAYAGLNASVQSGARVFWAYTFHDVAPLNYTVAEQIPNFREIASGGTLDGTNVELGIAYDFWGPNPPPETSNIADLAREFNISVLTAHSVSGPWRVDNLPEDLNAFGILNTSIPVVLSHGSYISAKDIQLLRDTNQFVSITPESEMHYGHGHPDSYFLQDQAALGVDTHYTFSSDILTQARIWLQKTRYHLYEDALSKWQIPRNNPMSVVQAFTLATRAGGLALRRPDLGVLEEGAKADLLVWDAANSPSLLGWVDPIAAIILHAGIGDILHVMVNGQFVKRDSKLTASNYKDVKERFLKSAKGIQERYRKIPYPVLEENWYGGHYEYTDIVTVDAMRGEGTGYGDVYV